MFKSSIKVVLIVILLTVVTVNGTLADHHNEESSSEADTKSVEIMANKLKFKPDTITAKAGQKLTITMKNEGFVSHSYDILKPGEEETSKDDESFIARTHSVQPDSFVRTTVTIDEPGEYKFICDVATHVKAGMKGTLTITEN